jgi:hypothetical protein
VQRPAVTHLAGLGRQIQLADLPRGNSKAREREVNPRSKVSAQFPLDGHVDEDACWVVVTDIEDPHDPAGGLDVVDVLGSLERERDA